MTTPSDESCYVNILTSQPDYHLPDKTLIALLIGYLGTPKAGITTLPQEKIPVCVSIEIKEPICRPKEEIFGAAAKILQSLGDRIVKDENSCTLGATLLARASKSRRTGNASITPNLANIIQPSSSPLMLTPHESKSKEKTRKSDVARPKVTPTDYTPGTATGSSETETIIPETATESSVTATTSSAVATTSSATATTDTATGPKEPAMATADGTRARQLLRDQLERGREQPKKKLWGARATPSSATATTSSATTTTTDPATEATDPVEAPMSTADGERARLLLRQQEERAREQSKKKFRRGR